MATVTIALLLVSLRVPSAQAEGEDGRDGGMGARIANQTDPSANTQTRTKVESQGKTITGTIGKRGRAGSSTRTDRSASRPTSDTSPAAPSASTGTRPTKQRNPTEQELAAYREAMARWAHGMQICQHELDVWGNGRVSPEDCLAKQGPPPANPTTSTPKAEADDPPVIDPAILAQRAVATLTLPTVTPKIGPPPSVNQWHIAAVGYPLWLWTTGPDTRTATVTLDGVRLTLTARRVATRFDMGEPGARPVVCTTTTPWTPSVDPAQPSPACGYTYQHASITRTAPDGTYTIRATERWEVTWSALGATGVIPLQTSGTTTLPVGEIQTVRLP